jgi:hypothetical protein
MRANRRSSTASREEFSSTSSTSTPFVEIIRRETKDSLITPDGIESVLLINRYLLDFDSRLIPNALSDGILPDTLQGNTDQPLSAGFR